MIRKCSVIKATLLCGLALLLLALPALGGGWAVITLDTLPGEIRAGEAFDVSFTVRQHGVTPMADLDPTVSLRNAQTAGKFTFRPEPGKDIGRYYATITLPAEGEWSWSIQAFSMDQAMPPLTVLPAAATQQPVNQPLNLTPFVLLGILLLGMLSALLAFHRKRARWGYALIAVSLVVGAFAAITMTGQTSQPALAAGKGDLTTEALTGEELFVAKGCLTCHNHSRAKVEGSYDQIGVGPDLSKYTASPEYLRLWLADPGGIKPEATMPNLDLTEGEIEALIAFLNAE